MELRSFSPDYLAFLTRSCDLRPPFTVKEVDHVSAGDLVVGVVEKVNSSCRELELHLGGSIHLEPGKSLVGVLGSTRTLRGFSGIVPSDSTSLIHLDLLSRDGLLGSCTAFDRSLEWPTRLRYLGSPVDERGLAQKVKPSVTGPISTRVALVPALLVVGSDSGVGKTSLCSSVIRAFCSQGLRVHAGKIGGVSSQNDLRKLSEAGAARLASSEDLGILPEAGKGRLDGMVSGVIAELLTPSPDLLILEAGGGVWEESQLRSLLEVVGKAVPNFLLAICVHDLAGASAMISWAKQLEQTDPREILVSGKVTDSASTIEHLERHLGVVSANCFDGIGKIREFLQEQLSATGEDGSNLRPASAW